LEYVGGHQYPPGSRWDSFLEVSEVQIHFSNLEKDPKGKGFIGFRVSGGAYIRGRNAKEVNRNTLVVEELYGLV